MSKSSLSSSPDAYATNPLMTLLPVYEVSRLDIYTSSFYARYERVKNQRLAYTGHTLTEDVLKGILAEELLLKEVLEWLAIRPVDE
jgi:hypothetical protein